MSGLTGICRKRAAMVGALLVIGVAAGPSSGLEWTRRYDGPLGGLDAGLALVVDTVAGAVYVAGQRAGLGSSDLLLLKYDLAGNLLWERSYDGTAHAEDRAVAMAGVAAGGVIVLGATRDSLAGMDIVTLRYDAGGTLLWAAAWDGPGVGDDEPVALALDGSGNALVTGITADTLSTDVAVLKYSPNGTLLWQYLYDGPLGEGDVARALAVDANGNVLVAGYTSEDSLRSDYLTLKLSAAGEFQWARVHGDTAGSEDWAAGVATGPSGEVYVTGFTALSNLAADMMTVKYDGAGMLQWDRRLGGPGDTWDEGTGLRVGPDGNLNVIGVVTGTGGDYNMVLARYSSAGALLWDRKYAGPAGDWDEPVGLAFPDASSILVTGASLGADSTFDYVTLKYTDAGTLVGLHRYTGMGGMDFPAVVAPADSGYVVVTGSSESAGGVLDVATLRLLPTSDTIPVDVGEARAAPASFALDQNVPNPFAERSAVAFELPRAAEVTLVVYDLAGREVRRVVQRQHFDAGRHHVDLRGAGLPSGLYLFRLEAFAGGERLSFVRKMLIVR